MKSVAFCFIFLEGIDPTGFLLGSAGSLKYWLGRIVLMGKWVV
jgi:hypothetical protein